MRHIASLDLRGNTLKYKMYDAVHDMEFEGERVLIHLNTDQYYSLDDVGQVVWKLLKSGLNKVEIVRELCLKFDNTVSLMEVTQDVDELIDDLLYSGLILPVSE